MSTVGWTPFRIGELTVQAVQRAFGARAVVAADVDDQRVVELAGVLDRLDHATDLVVGIGQVRRVDVGLADVELLRLVRERVPLRQVSGQAVSWRPAGSRRASSGWRRSCRRSFLALVEQMHVADLVDPLRRRMVRRVRAAGRVVDHERPVGLDLVQHLDAPIASSAMAVIRFQPGWPR